MSIKNHIKMPTIRYIGSLPIPLYLLILVFVCMFFIFTFENLGIANRESNLIHRETLIDSSNCNKNRSLFKKS